MACICLLGIVARISCYDEPEDMGYENKILAIEEFDTPTSTKIMISFEHQNPICVYSPETFQESLDDTVYRAFMPKTDVASDVTCCVAHDEGSDQAFDCDQSDAGVELILYGDSIQKFIEKDHILFIVKK